MRVSKYAVNREAVNNVLVARARFIEKLIHDRRTLAVI